jgi:hypothetical protein
MAVVIHVEDQEGKWITVKGAHVLIGKEGEVKAGAGGKSAKTLFGKGAAHHEDSRPRQRGYVKPATPRLDAKSEEMLQDAQANWYDNTTEQEKDASITTAKIKLSDLKTVQFGVSEAKVKKMTEKFDPSKEADKPWVDMFDGVPVISDGNHRVEAALARGETHLEMNVRELTKYYKPGYRNEPPPKGK